jgi:hypothetical protein
VATLTDAGGISDIFRTRISEDNTFWDYVNGMTCDAAGNIFIVSSAKNLSNEYTFGTAKIKSDLSGLDTTFGGDGTALQSIGAMNNDTPNAVAVDLSNKIIVTGYVQSTADRCDEALIRLNPDGSLDQLGIPPGPTVTLRSTAPVSRKAAASRP